MASALTLGTMSPQLVKVVERAQREPEGRFHSLAHLIDVPALERAYRRMRKGRKRSAHDAIRTLDRIVHRGEVSWILEADIVSFFDSLDRKKLKEMLEVRVADGSLLRLIGKCLHVGVLEGVELSTPESGTAQGSVLTPPTQRITWAGIPSRAGNRMSDYDAFRPHEHFFDKQSYDPLTFGDR